MLNSVSLAQDAVLSCKCIQNAYSKVYHKRHPKKVHYHNVIYNDFCYHSQQRLMQRVASQQNENDSISLLSRDDRLQQCDFFLNRHELPEM